MPVQPGVGRMRTWMLAEAAAAAGHTVTWWSSTHSHQQKQLLATEDRTVDVDGRFTLRMIQAGAYKSNRSLRRVLHHRQLARRFSQLAESESRPDIIVASYPIIGFAQAAIDFGRKYGIPVVVDVRDPWPDVFRTLFPSSLSWLGEATVRFFDRDARRCLAGSSGIVAVSEGFLAWALEKAGLSRRTPDRVFYIGGHAAAESMANLDRNAVIPSASLRPDQVVIAFVGSFGHSYQLDLIGDLARRLSQQGNDNVHFVLVGDGMQRDAVAAYAEALSNVTYLGWQDANTVRRVLAVTDIGIAPYNVLPGCMPNKVCEYLAAGLPVLNSTYGDLPPLLEEYEAGFSYAPGDLDALYAHVMRICDDRALLGRLTSGAARLYNDRFVADKIYGEYVDFLVGLAAA